MNSITQNMRFRESLLKYAEHHGIQKAMRQYNVHKSYIYRWRERWLESGKDIESLRDISRRPKTSPSLHTEPEDKLIRDLVRRNPHIGLPELWQKLQARGYSRSPSGLFKALQRLNLKVVATSSPSPTYKPKPYEEMDHPGERVQIDVKHVPKECLHLKFKEGHPDVKLYQFTAIDEFSRIRYLKGYSECSTYTSSDFLEHAIRFYKKLDITIECVQTDNGPEFTKRLVIVEVEAGGSGNGGTGATSKTSTGADTFTLFEKTAFYNHIRVKHIRPHTPRHNGKVERSHREDQKLLYTPLMNPKSKRKIWSVNDLNVKLNYHMKKTNNRPMRPLGMLSPMAYLKLYREQPQAFYERFPHKLSTKKKEPKKK